jgi:Ca2+-binding RTX toxin-like protein
MRMGSLRFGGGRRRTVGTLIALATISPLLVSTAGAQAPVGQAGGLTPRVAVSKAAVAAQPVDPANRRIILKFREGTRVRARGATFVSPTSADVTGVNGVLAHYPGVTVERLFKRPEADLTREKAQVEARSRRQVADLNLYYRVIAPEGADVAALIAALNQLPVVEAASSEPKAVPPPTHTDFTAQQGYLDPAPGGIDSDYARTLPGGKGENITIADIEYSWNVNHEDLARARAAGAILANGTPTDPFMDNNHGTAVIGEISATENDFGVTGIVSEATLRLVNASNTDGYNLANAINTASGPLVAGDVILIEQQTAGPVDDCDEDQVGCVAVEWVQAFYDAIVVATAEGIIVVEAAGNGFQDLGDTANYGDPFPSGRADSGAIIVGAGNAPGCTAPPRGRQDFSDFGPRVNLQGWGQCVVTTGYGDLQDGDPNHWYTDSFGGTSSASPIVAGAAGVVSSVAQQRGVTLTPLQVRTLLQETGTPQEFGLAGNIGPLPNLRRALQRLSCSTPPTATITAAGPGLLTIGTPGDDVIQGTAGADRIAGLGGNDLILGGDGNDELQGGDGDDMLCGAGGNDRLAGAAGNDYLDGGAGNDDLAGGPGDDLLFGGGDVDRLAGDAGTDRCVAGGQAGDVSAPAPHCDTTT